MKVLLVNTYDRGGAANSCLRLHQGLLKEGINSNVLLRYKSRSWPHSYPFVSRSKELTFLGKIGNKIKFIGKELKLFRTKLPDESQKFLGLRPKGLEMFSFPKSGIDITTSEIYEEADIINLHWVANFLDFETFFKKNTKPVVWTLHDMNAFTGGEHYEEKYLGMNALGFPELRVYTNKELKTNDQNLEFKKRALLNVSNLTIVAPSLWLVEKARNSELFGNLPVHHIPYSLDSTIFSLRDKNFSRDVFDIPHDKKVILFVADSISNNRKGFIYLQKAFEQLEDENLLLCAVGNQNPNLDAWKNVLELGPVHDERLMSLAYSAADVFVIPSLMDNSPNTVLESLMCGTPVIGFPVGGIPEMIQDEENGLLTKEISVPALVKTLREFLASSVKYNKEEIRKKALQKYDHKIQAVNYIKLFDQILKIN